ncbi:MAG: amidase family protein [Pseudomonadota bacterium]
MTEPCDLDAVTARALIGARKLSPVELFDSCLARTQAVNPALNAVVTLDADLGRAQAREAEAAVMAGTRLGRLHGLPVAIKDNRPVRGLRTTHGSLVHAEDPPSEADEPMIARLRTAGPLLYARTNQPEFGTGANTKNRLFGATGNPFDTTRTPAGSSGGSAVALACGMAPLATGSDYGGSLRTPAAFCGVAGFRPSPGVVPAAGSATLLQPWPVNGPMARSVADLRLMLGAMAAHDPRDAWSAPHDGGYGQTRPLDLAGLRIAYSPDLGCCPVDASVAETFGARMAGLAPLLASAAPGAPDFGPVHDVLEITRGVAFLASHADLVARARDKLDTNLLDNVDRARAYTAADVAWAEAEQAKMYRRFLAFFDTVDVLIAPAAAVAPFPHAQLYPATVGGAEMPTYMRWLALAYAPTLCLACAAAIPCGRGPEGLPFGIQVIGPHRADRRVLAAAEAIEAHFAADPATARPIPDIAALTAAPPMAAATAP